MAHAPKENIEHPKRRTFLSVVIAFIGGLISLAMGGTAYRFCNLPSAQKDGAEMGRFGRC